MRGEELDGDEPACLVEAEDDVGRTGRVDDADGSAAWASRRGTDGEPEGPAAGAEAEQATMVAAARRAAATGRMEIDMGQGTRPGADGFPNGGQNGLTTRVSSAQRVPGSRGPPARRRPS